MSDWGTPIMPVGPSGFLSTAGECSPVADMAVITTSVFASNAAWSSANLAIFCPILVTYPVTINKMTWQNGGTVSGNVDVGIYDAAHNKVVSSGSTAQTGASVGQNVTVSASMDPGLYYLAMAMDNTTGTIQRLSYGVKYHLQVSGVAQMASAFPLPSSATFAQFSQTQIPLLIAQINPVSITM